MKMVFCLYGLEAIVDGSRVCPVLPAEANDQQRKDLTEWQKDDAKAASFIAGAVNRAIAELVLTCVHAKGIWDKLCARSERSSTQRLNMLIESFFRSKRDEKEDVSTQVAKLQKLFVDLNSELEKHNENTLSERMLNSRILSTLGKEYDNFKDLWDTIPTDQQKLNLLIEKLCSIELREIGTESTVSGNATAFAVFKNNGKKKHFDRGKKILGKMTVQRRNFHVIGASRSVIGLLNVLRRKMQNLRAHQEENTQSVTFWRILWKHLQVKPSIWTAGAVIVVRHITLCKQNFVSYEEFRVPEIVSLGKRKLTMQAYGKGTINIQVYHHGRWHDRRMKNVWYVPNASANLFSVKAVAQNGFSVLLDRRGVQVKEEHTGRLVATGYLSNELYLMKMRVVKPNQAVQVKLTSVTDTLQMFHEHFAHQNKSVRYPFRD